jgi:ArsR family transcriptional regulator, arsenate/arsenite/antimonite-responsive transcriptional repressor
MMPVHRNSHSHPALPIDPLSIRKLGAGPQDFMLAKVRNFLDSRLYIDKSGYMEQENAILALAALAQSTRLDVFRLLVKHEPDGLAAGDIARAIAVPQNTMSAHLAILARASLVMSERKSRSIVYRANLVTFGDLTSFMVEDCCGGRAELCAPKAACKPARAKHAKVKA